MNRRRALLLLLLLPLMAAPVQAQAPEGWVIDQLHLFVQVEGEWADVIEYHLLGNRGAGTEAAAELRFRPPEGAREARLSEGGAGRFRLTEEGIALLDPIPPGRATQELRYSYTFPLQAEVPLRLRYPLPAEAVVVVLVGEGVALAGEGLVYQDEIEIEGRRAQIYVADPLPAEAPLALRFTMGAPGRSAALPAELWVGGGALLVALGVVTWWWQSRKPRSASAPPPEIRPLLLRIAELDERFAAGALDAERYEVERAALLAQVRECHPAP